MAFAVGTKTLKDGGRQKEIETEQGLSH